MKIGLLGGSFNPVHNGHIRLAQTALDLFKLDKILFLPSGNHPLKRSDDMPTAQIRFNITRKALLEFPQLEISKLDMQHNGPSYTKKLIQRLKHEFPDDELFFIAGSDIVLELKKWHEFRWLLDNIQFIIAHRPDIDRAKWDKLDYVDKLMFMQMEPVDISSTMIRKLIAENKDISNLVSANIVEDLAELYS